MNNSYIKEKKSKVFDVSSIEPGDVIKYYRHSGEVRTATENALVIKVTEEQIIGLIYRQGPVQNFDYIIFLPDSEGVEIEEVIRGYSY